MLNEVQRNAIKTTDGPMLVLAGAGTGKTRVITHKIAYLIEQMHLSPTRILALTFTNKAAKEMRERVSHLLPAEKRRGLRVVTFHTLGLSIIKRALPLCDLRPGFSILDAEDTLDILRAHIPAAMATERASCLTIQMWISRWKQTFQDIHQVATTDSLMEAAKAAYAGYHASLNAYNAIDFDDLILMPVRLFNQHPDLLEQWQLRLLHVLVDEYQDTNDSQYALIRQLTGFHRSFTVVGDDDQSIYAWRGAKPEHLAKLAEDYPSLAVIKLEQNYRSTAAILHTANSLIAHNPHVFEKRLWSDRGHGEKIRVICCHHEQDEAERVVTDMISRVIREGTKYADYAILYRGNHQSRAFENSLRHHGIRYRVSGGQSWFGRREIKDMLAYLKLLCNESDNAAFLRAINTPKRGIGDTTLAALNTYAARVGKSLYASASHLGLASLLADKPRTALQAFTGWIDTLKARLENTPVKDVLRMMLTESGYENGLYEQSTTRAQAQKAIGEIQELFAWIERMLVKKPHYTLKDVMNTFMLIDLMEQQEEADAQTVQLMTLHAAKGLEFPHVYLVGVEEDMLPHHTAITPAEIEEERRLAYVGITRAQETLCLTVAMQRKYQGALQTRTPSRFIDELPEDLLTWYGKPGAVVDKAAERANGLSHLAALKALLTE